jgi:hypothetical protein
MIMVKETPTVKPPGLNNDFSEQEKVMTSAAMPPKFALTAGTGQADGPSPKGRNVVPFGGFGGDLEMDEECTTTVLGRCVEGASYEEMMQNVDEALGTNYFRYQSEFMVGKNKGGGNVLDVADRTYTWPLNNAWLQAAVDRGDRIRFISDPADPSTLYKKGGTIKDDLTITGRELGVLLHRGYAPNESTGIVQAGYLPNDERLCKEWEEIAEKVEIEGHLKAIDNDAYAHFLDASQEPTRTPKEYKGPNGDIVAEQTNFFGGIPAAVA